MKKVVNNLIDLFVIVVQISFHISIVPYFIYANFEPANLVLLFNSVIIFLLAIIRFNGRISFDLSLLRFPPFIIFFLLLFFQLISGFIKQEINYIGAPIVFAINFFVFIIYINNFYKEQLKLRDPFDSFIRINSPYLFFALFNVSLVIIAALLFSFNILSSFTNNINDLYPNLLGSNVESGTLYYMPSWLSIQTYNSRLGFNFGNLMGWTHEPHVFGNLVFPAFFLFLAKYINHKFKFYLISILFGISFLISFSVTSFVVLSIIFVVKLVYEKKFKLILLLISILLIAFVAIEKSEVIDKMLFQVFLKFTDDTSSLDYSVNKLEYILIPNKIFGDGVMLLSNSEMKDAGFFSAILYIMFYVSLIIKTFQIIFTQNRQNLYVGLAFLYFILHSFKLTSSVFAMPYYVYLLTVMAFYYKDCVIQANTRKI